MRSDVPVRVFDLLKGLALLVAVALLMIWLLPDDAPPHVAPVDRFASCFESVVPRAQFFCPDGTIWTRTVDGWSVDRSGSSMPRTPAG